MTFDDFSRCLGELKVDKADGREKPYKPLLLAAVIVLIHKGTLRSPRIFLDGGLRSAFGQLVALLFPDWRRPAKPELPFRHLETDGIWRLVPLPGAGDALAHARGLGEAAHRVLRHVLCAELDEDVFARLASDAFARMRVLITLSDRWFPPERCLRLLNLVSNSPSDLPTPPVPLAADGDVLTEKALEEHLERNWSATPFAKDGYALDAVTRFGFSPRQHFTPVNAIDMLAYDPRRRRWLVVELKRGKPSDSVVGQTLRYLGWLRSTRDDHSEESAAAIVARTADAKLRAAVKGAGGHVTLWEYDSALRLRAI